MDDYSLYDSSLDKVGPDSLLTEGTYYLQTVLEGSSLLTVSRSGMQMSVGDTIVVNHSGVFKYDLTVGEEYEVRIGKAVTIRLLPMLRFLIQTEEYVMYQKQMKYTRLRQKRLLFM